MADIFISYKRESDSELFGKPILKFVELLKFEFHQITNINLDIFYDIECVNPGDKWKKKLDDVLDSTDILIAFISSGYFASDYCYKEFTSFFNSDYPHKKKVIPIQITNIDIDTIPKNRLQTYNDIQSLQIVDFEEEYRTNGEYNSSYKKKILEIINVIKDPIKQRLKIGCACNSNIQIFNNINLLNFKKNNYDKIIRSIKESQKKYSSKPVSIIYTGGSVGLIHDKKDSKHNKNDLYQGNVNQIVKHLPKLHELEVDIHFFEISPIDSSNATFQDWTNLAKLMGKIYDQYQGFVILHGANTMAYAASYLSFVFEDLNKPIIFTGSENPLTKLDSDAELNVLRSIQIAAHESIMSPRTKKVSEVCIFYGDKLFRGNRATKYHAFNPAKGFLTLNSPEIGVFANNRLNLNPDPITHQKQIKRDSNKLSLRLPDHSNPQPIIIILDVYPDMPINEYVQFLKNIDKLDGLILRTYGTGNPPDKPDTLISAISDQLNKGTIVLNTTQSPEGRVLIKLYETNATLFDLGVINGGDMTKEAAYTKLMWLLYTETNLKDIKAKLQKNIRGELKYSSFNFQTTTPYKNSQYHLIKPINIAPEIKQLDEVDHVIIRITKIKILEEIDKDKNYILNVLYNPKHTKIDQLRNEGYDNSILTSYQKDFDPQNEIYDKNLEITFEFKQFFHPNQLAINIGLIIDPPLPFEFESFGLYVFTKSEL